jgi:hypothetical protein
MIIPWRGTTNRGNFGAVSKAVLWPLDQDIPHVAQTVTFKTGWIIHKGALGRNCVLAQAALYNACHVSSQKVGAIPCGCPCGQMQDLPLPRIIEKITHKEQTK